MKKIKWKELIIALIIPLAIGGLSAYLTKDSMEHFESLAKPPLAPPSWLFPVVWTILFILMGAASYLVYISKASEARKDRALTIYAVQLAFNFFWTLIFFNMGLYLAAFIWLIILWLLIIAATVLFWFISKPAGKLMIPYLLWVTFAGYLNLGIYLLNR